MQGQVEESDTVFHVSRTRILVIPLQLVRLIVCRYLVFYHYATIAHLEHYVDAPVLPGVDFYTHPTAAQVAIDCNFQSTEEQAGENRALAMRAAWVQQVGENGRVRLHLIRFAVEDREDRAMR